MNPPGRRSKTLRRRLTQDMVARLTGNTVDAKDAAKQ